MCPAANISVVVHKAPSPTWLSVTPMEWSKPSLPVSLWRPVQGNWHGKNGYACQYASNPNDLGGLLGF
jgi:hypothetical protein